MDQIELDKKIDELRKISKDALKEKMLDALSAYHKEAIKEAYRFEEDIALSYALLITENRYFDKVKYELMMNLIEENTSRQIKNMLDQNQISSSDIIRKYVEVQEKISQQIYRNVHDITHLNKLDSIIKQVTEFLSHLEKESIFDYFEFAICFFVFTGKMAPTRKKLLLAISAI